MGNVLLLDFWRSVRMCYSHASKKSRACFPKEHIHRKRFSHDHQP